VTLRGAARAGLPAAGWLLLGLCALVALPARAQELRYEPPPVDLVYPLAEGEVPSPNEVDPAAPLPAAPARAPADVPKLDEPPAAPPAPEVSDGGDFGARALVVRPMPGPKRVDLESARDLPGAFGDPLRILDSLPGVVPVASGVPYVYVRGAPPAAQGYVYDDIPLPQLFHGAFFAAVIHPRMTGPMRFYAGVPPARYGRRSGGLVLAEGSKPLHTLTGEIEVRLIDLGGYIEVPVGAGDIVAAGRIGYPKLALLAASSLGILDPDTRFNYWDGQFRYSVPVSRQGRAEFVWLGSYDTINLPGLSDNPRAGASRIEFHRVETRFVQELSRDAELGVALRFGFDGSELGDALMVRAFTFGPRMWSRFKLGAHTLRFGAEIFSSTGDVVDSDGTLGSPDGDIQVSVPDIAEASARNQGGIWSEATVKTSDETRLELGLRLDYWSVLSEIDLAVDPRLRFVVDATDDLELHAAFGTAHQPAVFLLPVPGLTDVALDRGLTRSIQSELGATYQLPQDVEVEVQGFLHHYDGMLLPELVQDGLIENDPPLVSAIAYGVELFLRREIGRDLSGWISYTLGWAEADSGPEVIGKFKPDFDVRHVLNVVAQWRIWRGLTVGGRMQARSGRMVEQVNPRYEQRLPWFVRADMRVGYRWEGRWSTMLVYFEWLNMLVRREYLDADCLLGQCRATSAPPISIPNLGVRAEF
jgi:hypothetical protein